MKRLLLLILWLLGSGLAQQTTTLAQIEADPAAFDGRKVVLIGYHWSWFKPKVPEVCEGLPLARGNLMRTRSDGSFCDGTRVAYLPPGGEVVGELRPGAAVQLVARVHAGPEGWWLEPLVLR
ncbi:hypothetical protein [Oceanithermus sp.]